MCARSHKEKMSWMKTIQKAYEDFWTSYGLAVPVKTGGVSHEDMEHVANDLQILDMLEISEVEEMKRELELKKCMLLWKYYTKLRKAEKSLVT